MRVEKEEISYHEIAVVLESQMEIDVMIDLLELAAAAVRKSQKRKPTRFDAQSLVMRTTCDRLLAQLCQSSTMHQLYPVRYAQ